MPDLRQFKLKRTRGRAPKPVGFKIVQASYYRAIQQYAEAAHALIRATLIPKLEGLVARNAAIHTDAAMPPGRRVSLILEGAARKLDKSFTLQKLEALAAKAAKETAELNRKNLFRQIRAVVGVDLSSIADRGLAKRVGQFTAENVSLIKSIPSRYFDEVEKVVHVGVRDGTRHEDLADQIEERFGVADFRAALIARDQVLKFNGSLNKARQTDLGIQSYTWRTVEDERVREAHVERDGNVYRWDDPPGDPDDPADGGHPGVAIQCRCWPEPSVEELLSTIEEDE